MNAVDVISIRSSATGRTIRATAAADLEALARGILTEFEEHAPAWRDGYTIELGWGPLTLRADGEEIIVVAPDYARDPAHTTEDLSLTIWLAVSLNALPSAAGLSAAQISFDDDVICVKEWERHPLLSLTRIATTTPRDSGWFVEPFPPASDEPWRAEQLVRLPAWRVLQERRAVARSFGLPVGVTAIVEGDAVRTLVRESDRAVLAEGPL
ncbi:hypothetical protein [Microbacterium gilvum]|uniref:Uncharacterized protein n=1 Tax=Microbacterium gilvum TaxID=1336204 RepID=A0ABP9A128_9MICO